MVYIAYVTSSTDVHFSLWPSLVTATSLLRANATSSRTFDAVYVDADNNDVPPPHDAGASQPTLVMYASGAKTLPRYVDRFQEGRLTTYDILHFVALTSAQMDTASTAAALLRSAPSDVLLAKPWEDADSAWEEMPSWAQARADSLDADEEDTTEL